jgi:hypothetical protein
MIISKKANTNISFIYLFSKDITRRVTNNITTITVYIKILLPNLLLTFHNILYGSLFLVSL